MSEPVLVLDVTRLLDESAAGRGAAQALAKRFEEAKKRRETLVQNVTKASGSARDKAAEQLAAFEAKEARGLEEARASLRNALLTRAQPHVIRLLKERGAAAVLRAEELVVFRRELDITAEVVKAVDAEGELKPGA